jgi:hypothetical protein
MTTMAVAENMGFEHVVQTMEEDVDCDSTILRYCTNILGALQQEEFNRKLPGVPHVQNIWVDSNIISISF